MSSAIESASDRVPILCALSKSSDPAQICVTAREYAAAGELSVAPSDPPGVGAARPGVAASKDATSAAPITIGRVHMTGCCAGATDAQSGEYV